MNDDVLQRSIFKLISSRIVSLLIIQLCNLQLSHHDGYESDFVFLEFSSHESSLDRHHLAKLCASLKLKDGYRKRKKR